MIGPTTHLSGEVPAATASRVTSIVQAVTCAALAASIIKAPPSRSTNAGRPRLTVYESIAGSHVYFPAAFIAVAVFVLVAAVWLSLPNLVRAHQLAFVAFLTYGVANAIVSASNGTGWQIAALCFGLVGAHTASILLTPQSPNVGAAR